MDSRARVRPMPVAGTVRRPEPRWPVLFTVAAATFAVSALIATAVIIGAACGGAGAPFPLGGGLVGTTTPTATATATATPTGTMTTEPNATETASPATSATATETANPGETPTEGNGGPGSEPTETPDPAIVVGCGDILVPIDKEHRLGADCAPGGLQALPEALGMNRQEYLVGPAADALIQMIDDAAAAGHELFVASSYRSYQTQADLYQYWVNQLGPEQAARISARPGHSEHQLGTTADLTTAAIGGEPTEQFGSVPEGQWVAENSWRYGFIISYPAGKESVTGYAYEPWHLRWVGRGVAEEVHASGLTLREYLSGG